MVFFRQCFPAGTCGFNFVFGEDFSDSFDGDGDGDECGAHDHPNGLSSVGAANTDVTYSSGESDG